MAKWLDKLRGRSFRVFHRVPAKNRRDSFPCSGIAFYRQRKGPVPHDEVPDRCDTCGQPLKMTQLDLHEVMGDYVAQTGHAPVETLRDHVHPPKARPSRHYGVIVTEPSGAVGKER